MKALIALFMIATFCACNKQIEVAPGKQLSLPDFNSMLSKDKTWFITDYYNVYERLTVPSVNQEDTYTFDQSSVDGWVTSTVPCIEYHYNFRAYSNGNEIKFDWLNFKIIPQTYTLYDFKVDEWFILESGGIYTKYQLYSRTHVVK